MRLGYFAMPLHPPGADPATTMDGDLAQLATLDRLGYEEAWIGEHFTAQWENIPCPDLFIARALGMTHARDPRHRPGALAGRQARSLRGAGPSSRASACRSRSRTSACACT